MEESRKIIVIKIGSSVFVTRGRNVDKFRIHQLISQILILSDDGYGIVLVVSGAIATGFRCIDTSINNNITAKCAAGIGWLEVINFFYEYFRQNNVIVSQILLTKDLLSTKRLENNLLSILDFYLNSSVIPIINENDIVDHYSFGGNDNLAFTIASLLKADKLVILSSFKSYFGYGGGESKKEIMKKSKKIGLDTIIANGKRNNILLRLLWKKTIF